MRADLPLHRGLAWMIFFAFVNVCAGTEGRVIAWSERSGHGVGRCAGRETGQGFLLGLGNVWLGGGI